MILQLLMGDKSLMLRLSICIALLTINSYALTVVVAKEAFQFEEKLSIKKLRLVNVTRIKKACKPLTLEQIQNNEYSTTHYINRNSIICQKDVKTYSDEGVTFKFGALEIEKKGKIIFENDQFIRIKKADGKIEKIYKDGRLK